MAHRTINQLHFATTSLSLAIAHEHAGRVLNSPWSAACLATRWMIIIRQHLDTPFDDPFAVFSASRCLVHDRLLRPHVHIRHGKFVNRQVDSDPFLSEARWGFAPHYFEPFGGQFTSSMHQLMECSARRQFFVRRFAISLLLPPRAARAAPCCTARRRRPFLLRWLRWRWIIQDLPLVLFCAWCLPLHYLHS